MGLFEKPKLQITDLGSKFPRSWLTVLEREHSRVITIRFDTSNYRHRMEILIVGFYALKVSTTRISDSQTQG